MRIIICPVGDKPRVENIEPLDLEAMQRLVGGMVERVALQYDDEEMDHAVHAWINENGIAEGCLPNRNVLLWNEATQVLRGDFFVAREAPGEEGGVTVDLTDADIAKYIPLLGGS